MGMMRPAAAPRNGVSLNLESQLPAYSSTEKRGATLRARRGQSRCRFARTRPMRRTMNRSMLAIVFALCASAVVCAQQPQQQTPQPDPYEGVSHTPADDTITTAPDPQAKPPAGKPAVTQ